MSLKGLLGVQGRVWKKACGSLDGGCVWDVRVMVGHQTLILPEKRNLEKPYHSQLRLFKI